ncbi:hypothetical protein [Roseomonas indoligenes]|nr:hypothetical protein [Pararoseomonas indoligenes]
MKVIDEDVTRINRTADDVVTNCIQAPEPGNGAEELIQVPGAPV